MNWVFISSTKLQKTSPNHSSVAGKGSGVFFYLEGNVPGLKKREGIEALEVRDERGREAKAAVEQLPSMDAMSVCLWNAVCVRL